MSACCTGGARFVSTVRPPAGTNAIDDCTRYSGLRECGCGSELNRCAPRRQERTGARRALPSVPTGLTATDRADDAPHDPEDPEVRILADHDRRVLRIGRHQLHAILVGPVVLDRGLVVDE